MKKLLFIALLATSLSFGQFDKAHKALDSGIKTATTNVTSSTKEGVSTLYGDTKLGVSTVYGDVKDVVKTMSPEVKKAFNAIVTKTGSITQQAWDILVLQQKVWSICYLCVTISAILMWIRFFIQYKKMSENTDSYEEPTLSNIILTIILGCGGIALSIVSTQNFADMMTGFINPEFGAIKNIFQLYNQVK